MLCSTMKTIILCVVGSILLPSVSMAGTFADQCPEITVCAKVIGEMLGQKYVFDRDVKGQVGATPNLELTNENAEALFTNALNMNGFARVPVGTPNTFQIMRQRDARDSALPTIDADANTPPALPNNWDLYTMRYKASNPELVEHMARFSRSFMPANSRIIPVEWSGLLLITDTAANLKRIYDLIKSNDVKPTPEMKKQMQENRKRAEQQKMLDAQKKNVEDSQPTPTQQPKKKQ